MVNMKIMEFDRQNNVDQIVLLLDVFEFEIRNAYPPQISDKISFLQQGVFFPSAMRWFSPNKKNSAHRSIQTIQKCHRFFPKEKQCCKSRGATLALCQYTPRRFATLLWGGWVCCFCLVNQAADHLNLERGQIRTRSVGLLKGRNLKQWSLSLDSNYFLLFQLLCHLGSNHPLDSRYEHLHIVNILI